MGIELGIEVRGVNGVIRERVRKEKTFVFVRAGRGIVF